MGSSWTDILLFAWVLWRVRIRCVECLMKVLQIRVVLGGKI